MRCRDSADNGNDRKGDIKIMADELNTVLRNKKLFKICEAVDAIPDL